MPVREQDQVNGLRVNAKVLHAAHKSGCAAPCTRVNENCPLAAEQEAIANSNWDAVKSKRHYFSYPFGCDVCHSHALERISCMLVWVGFQPSSLMIFFGEATNRAESPGRRGDSMVGMA